MKRWGNSHLHLSEAQYKQLVDMSEYLNVVDKMLAEEDAWMDTEPKHMVSWESEALEEVVDRKYENVMENSLLHLNLRKIYDERSKKQHVAFVTALNQDCIKFQEIMMLRVQYCQTLEELYDLADQAALWDMICNRLTGRDFIDTFKETKLKSDKESWFVVVERRLRNQNKAVAVHTQFSPKVMKSSTGALEIAYDERSFKRLQKKGYRVQVSNQPAG